MDISSPSTQLRPRLNWRSPLAQAALLLLAIAVAAAASSAEESSGGELSLEEAAQKANNPLSDVWLLIVENDTSLLGGRDVPGYETSNVTLLEPVLPVPIFEQKWNLIFRPIVSIISSPVDKRAGKLFGKSSSEIAGIIGSTDPQDFVYGGERTTGLGDSVLLTLLGPNRDDGFVWGLGVTQIFPTATDEVLGQQKWQIGPAALAVRLGKDHGGLGIDNWNIGVLAQQWFSYAGDGDREKQNQANIQYFINWKMNATQLVGMTPNITIDYNKRLKEAVSFPIGLGTIGMFRIGRLPFRWGVEAQYFAVQRDDAGPRFNFKVFLAPIIANPFK